MTFSRAQYILYMNIAKLIFITFLPFCLSSWAKCGVPAMFPTTDRAVNCGESMKKIPLTQGKFALVDDEDFDWLNKWKWYAHKDYSTFYANRHGQGCNDKNILMHREIINVSKGQLIDHKDRNGLNNQKSNLRVCNAYENCCNRKLHSNNKTGFRGVVFYPLLNKYMVRIKNKNKTHCLGLYSSLIEAAKAYDIKAKQLHGEFARLNFPHTSR